MDFLFPYSENKIKPYLKMAVHRIQLENNKKTTTVKIQKRDVAKLLADRKEEKAKIRVEHIIREDFTIEGYEILELLCELVHERIRQITNSKECPDDLKEAVYSLIWAAHNVDIAELKEVSNQLTKKFGKEFATKATKNENNEVNFRLSQKLTYRPPSAKLVMGYLEEIAKGYQVDWEAKESFLEEAGIVSDEAPFPSPSGSSIPMAPGSGLTGAYQKTTPPPTQSQPQPQPPQIPPQPQNIPPQPTYQMNEYERQEHEAFLRNQAQAPTQVYPAYPVAQPVKTDPTIPTYQGYQGEIYAVPAPVDNKQSPPPEAPLAPPDSEMDDLQARLNALTKQNNL